MRGYAVPDAEPHQRRWTTGLQLLRDQPPRVARPSPVLPSMSDSAPPRVGRRCGVPLTVKENEAADPVRIGALSAPAVVAHPNRLAYLVEQFGRQAGAGRDRTGACRGLAQVRPRYAWRHSNRMPALSEELCEAVADIFPGSLHVRRLGQSGATDATVWALARQSGCLVVSKDEDFHRLALVRGTPQKFIWIRLGNCTTHDIALLCDVVTPTSFNSTTSRRRPFLNWGERNERKTDRRRRPDRRCRVALCRSCRGSSGSSFGCSQRKASPIIARIFTHITKTTRRSSPWTRSNASAAVCRRRSGDSWRLGRKFTGRNCSAIGTSCNRASRPSRSNHSGNP
jgi:predicted nuclease of predicted toxin-antitoxin system